MVSVFSGPIVFADRMVYMDYNETPTDWNAMFRRNRAIQVSMVKTPKNETSPEAKTDCTHKDPEQIALIAKDFVTHTAKAVGAVIITYALSTAITRIADNLTKKDDD